jgi:hypothetical protein
MAPVLVFMGASIQMVIAAAVLKDEARITEGDQKIEAQKSLIQELPKIIKDQNVEINNHNIQISTLQGKDGHSRNSHTSRALTRRASKQAEASHTEAAHQLKEMKVAADGQVQVFKQGTQIDLKTRSGGCISTYYHWSDTTCNTVCSSDPTTWPCRHYCVGASCDTMTKCPVDHALKDGAANLNCAGCLCDETVDAEACCQPAPDVIACAPRSVCVDTHLADLGASELVDFECECNEHYLRYRDDNVWPEATQEKCKQFIACLNSYKTSSVKVLTGIAKALKYTNTASLLQSNTSTASSSCFTPSPDKYNELTQCDCIKGLVNECGNDAGMDPTDECLRKLACRNDEVCQSWKDDNCAGNSLLQERRSSGNSDAQTSLSTSRLEDTLQSKCA